MIAGKCNGPDMSLFTHLLLHDAQSTLSEKNQDLRNSRAVIDVLH